MSSRLSLPEEDLCCPVCCDIFRDPVLLPCSHSFCRACLQRFWETSAAPRSCPVCRRRTSRRNPPANLALRNLCDAFAQGRAQREAAEASRQLCPQHGEKLKLFCQEDQLPICVVCQTSKAHKGHECVPVEEAASDCRAELEAALKTLQDQLAALSKVKSHADMTVEHIKVQAQSIGKSIKGQFLRLHQFLFDEEKAALGAVRREEEEKLQMAGEKAMATAKRMEALSHAARSLQQELTPAAGDLSVLQNFKASMGRVECVEPEGELAAGCLMDEARHLGNLRFRVWEQMRRVSPYFPVTVDPNTAHPCLSISDDLTALQYISPAPQILSNPERFRLSAEALGSTGFSSGSHSWVVDTAGNEDWILGLAYPSVPRNSETSARPKNGFWTLCLRDGVYRAMTSPPTVLTPIGKPKQIAVQLDWEEGEVSFKDQEEGTTLYTFTQTFAQAVFPYFYTQSTLPLRLLPQTPSLTKNI